MKISKYLIIAGILLSSAPTFAQNQTNTKMNLADLHTEDKAVQTKMMFATTEGKVVSLQIQKDKQLKEHITTVPALLVCVKGEVEFENEKGISIALLSGDYVNIEPNIKHWVNAKTDSNLLLIK
jgi:quercetin dioxygenase-like cupin family protein